MKGGPAHTSLAMSGGHRYPPTAAARARDEPLTRTVREQAGASVADTVSSAKVLPTTNEGTAMKVEVDYNLCESNGLCMQTLPEVFEVRDDDFLYLLTEDIRPDQEAAAEKAARICPRQAIKLKR
jgi:ferredoxin